MPSKIKIDGNLNVVIGDSNFGRLEDFIAARPEDASKAFLAVRALHAEILGTGEENVNAGNAAKLKAVADLGEAVDAFERAIALKNQAIAEAELAATKANARLALIVGQLRGMDAALLPPAVREEILTAEETEKAGLLRQQKEIEKKLGRFAGV